MCISAWEVCLKESLRESTSTGAAGFGGWWRGVIRNFKVPH